MSEFGGALNRNNVLDMVNGDGSRDCPENCAECIVNADEDTILPPVDCGQRAWAFMLGAFMIEGLMWGKYVLSHVNYFTNVNRFPVSIWSLPNILSK